MPAQPSSVECQVLGYLVFHLPARCDAVLHLKGRPPNSQDRAASLPMSVYLASPNPGGAAYSYLPRATPNFESHQLLFNLPPSARGGNDCPCTPSRAERLLVISKENAQGLERRGRKIPSSPRSDSCFIPPISELSRAMDQDQAVRS